MKLFIFSLLVLVDGIKTDDGHCQKPVDMVFLIDTSASVTAQDFAKQREFILDVVRKLNVGPSNEHSRVAAITFSNEVRFQFKLCDCSSPACVLEKIKNVKHDQGDATRTYVALEQAYKIAFDKDSGERKDVENVVVVCTDGQTNPGRYYYDDMIQGSGKFETLKQATEVKKIPALVFSIGIGQKVDIEELIGIASNPSDKYVIAVSDYDKLNSDETKQMLLTRTCKDTENPQKDQGCKELRADVFFALDTSSSLKTQDNFQKEVALVKKFIDDVVIGKTKVQVGLLTFSSNANMQLHLDAYHNKKELVQAINEKTFQVDIRGDTYIDKAIDMVIDEGFNAHYGARSSNVPHIFVIVTDGQSTRQSLTNKAIERLKSTNIITYAVGVGPKTSKNELLKIASTPNHMFNVKELDKLEDIKKELFEDICAEFHQKEEVPQKEEECKESKADIMFLLDGSSSISTDETFKKELDFVKSIIDGLDIDNHLVRVGVMQFANDTKLEFGLSEYSDKQQLAEAVSKISWMGGNTFLEKALEQICIEMNPDNLRMGVPHLLIYVSDGKSTNPYQTQLQMQKVREETDLIMIVIGVGDNRNMAELESLATKPLIRHVFDVDNQNALPSIRRNLLSTVCQAEKPHKSPTLLNNNLMAMKKGKNGFEESDRLHNLDRVEIDKLGHQLRGVSTYQDSGYRDSNRINNYREDNVMEKKSIVSLLKKILEKENERRNFF